MTTGFTAPPGWLKTLPDDTPDESWWWFVGKSSPGKKIGRDLFKVVRLGTSRTLTVFLYMRPVDQCDGLWLHAPTPPVPADYPLSQPYLTSRGQDLRTVTDLVEAVRCNPGILNHMGYVGSFRFDGRDPDTVTLSPRSVSDYGRPLADMERSLIAALRQDGRIPLKT